MINKIICGNSLDVLKKIPNNSIHIIITSPPYNVGMGYDSVNDRKRANEYFDFLKNILIECYRILVRGGRICINLPSIIRQTTFSKEAYTSIKIWKIMEDIGFLPREMIIWIKGIIKEEINAKGKKIPVLFEINNFKTSWGSWMSPSNPSLRDNCEIIIVMCKETQKLVGDKNKIDITKEEFMTYTRNVWYMLPEMKFRKFHPAPFPVELPLRCIKLYSYVDNIVLDPFNGIGTTTYAAFISNRRYIGIDISKEYCKIAEKRIREEIEKRKNKNTQLNLF